MKPILVAGTGLCYAAAVGYFAPLAQALGDTELHILEQWGLAPIERSVDRLVRRLHQLDGRATLIGHSQGGLVAALASEIVPDLVDRVVTICAPLHGTARAPSWSPLPCIREMSRRRQGGQPWQGPSTMINVVAADDRLVVPFTSGLREGAEHHVLTGVGHCGIMLDGRLHRLIKEVIARPARLNRPAA